MDFDYAPDPLSLTPPKVLIDTFKKDLHDEAYATLNEEMEAYEVKKRSYEGESLFLNLILKMIQVWIID